MTEAPVQAWKLDLWLKSTARCMKTTNSQHVFYKKPAEMPANPDMRNGSRVA
jgi:hypothetical protein